MLKYKIIDLKTDTILMPFSSMISSNEEAVLALQVLNSDPEEPNRYYLEDAEDTLYLANYQRY